MEVTNQIMYHYHKIGLYDEIWQVGKEFNIDNEFRSFYSKILDVFTTGVPCEPDDHFESFDRVIRYYLEDEKFSKLDKTITKRLLEESMIIIKNMNVFRRELELEEYRKQNYPDLPSRLHSIWLTDEEGLEFWRSQLNGKRNVILFKVSITGNLFKSSDRFIPDDELSQLEMYNSSEKYWNPSFKEQTEEDRVEYLFQGKIKILEKIK